MPLATSGNMEQQALTHLAGHVNASCSQRNASRSRAILVILPPGRGLGSNGRQV